MSHGAGNDGDREGVLIVRLGAMGDVLHALPAVAALRRAQPELLLHWVIEPQWSPLLVSRPQLPGGQVPGGQLSGEDAARDPSMPVIDGWHAANARAWKQAPASTSTLADIGRLRRELRRQRFGLAVDMQGTIRSAVLGRIAGAGRLVGSASPREAPARWFYRERVDLRARHVVEQGCELLGAAAREPLSPAPVELPVDSDAELWATEFLGGGAGPLVLLAPTAGWGAKQWPAERFGQLAARLAREGCRVLVNAASATDPVGLRVVEASGGVARIAVCSLGQLIALTRRSSLVVAGDTGPLHLAAALAVPVVGLYGPTDPQRTGPWGTRSRVLRDPASVTDHRRHATTEAGLARIPVDGVMMAAFELLERSPL